MANDFNWVDESTLDGNLWEDGDLFSEVPIEQIGTLVISGSSYGSYKYLDVQLNNTGTIVEKHASSIDNLWFEDGAAIDNLGTYELQKAVLINEVGSTGEINNSGEVLKTTSSRVEIDVSFNNYLNDEIGTVDVREGELILARGGNSGGGNFNIDGEAILEFRGNQDSIYTLNKGSELGGTGTIVLGDNSVLDIQVDEGTSIADSLELNIAGGTLQTDGDWSLLATTNWQSGILFSPGTITNSGTITIDDISYDSPKYLDARLDNTGTIIENNDGSFGELQFQDGAILNNSGIYELQAGKITASVSDSAVIDNSGEFLITASELAEIDVDFNNTGTIEARSGTLDLNGAYTHENAQIILKEGEINFEGISQLDLNGGSIEGNGIINVGVNNSGLLDPQYYNDTEIGLLIIDGDYVETDAANIEIEIGSDSIEDLVHDEININGVATLNGALNVSLLDEFIPTVGDRFDVVSFESLDLLSKLDFAGLEIDSNLQFVPTWSDEQLSLEVADTATLSDLSELNVTTTEDIVDPDDEVLSLREAIIQANETTLDKTITLGEGTYNLDISGRKENLAETGDLNILPRAGHITIQGQGQDKTILDANSLDRFWKVHPNAILTLSDLTITGGLALGADGADGADGANATPNIYLDGTKIGRPGGKGQNGKLGNPGYGGAIYNAGTLTIIDSNLSQNQAVGGDGGNGGNGGDGSIFDDEFVPPSGGNGGNGGKGGDGNGGAIYSSGELSLIGVTVEGNTVSSGNGGNGGDGGEGGTSTARTGASGEVGNGGNGGDLYGESIYNSAVEEIAIADSSQFSDNSFLTVGQGGTGNVAGELGTVNNGDTNGIYSENVEVSFADSPEI